MMRIDYSNVRGGVVAAAADQAETLWSWFTGLTVNERAAAVANYKKRLDDLAAADERGPGGGGSGVFGNSTSCLAAEFVVPDLPPVGSVGGGEVLPPAQQQNHVEPPAEEPAVSFPASRHSSGPVNPQQCWHCGDPCPNHYGQDCEKHPSRIQPTPEEHNIATPPKAPPTPPPNVGPGTSNVSQPGSSSGQNQNLPSNSHNNSNFRNPPAGVAYGVTPNGDNRGNYGPPPQQAGPYSGSACPAAAPQTGPYGKSSSPVPPFSGGSAPIYPTPQYTTPEVQPQVLHGPKRHFYAIFKPDDFGGPWFGTWNAVKNAAHGGEGPEAVWGKRCESEQGCRDWLHAHRHLVFANAALRVAY